MSKLWRFIVNPILNATKGSYSKAKQISIYHDAALFSGIDIPFVAALYASYHPIHEAYEEAYTKWDVQGGIKEGSTLSRKQLLKELSSTKIRDWDIAFQNVYRRGTPEYKKLLPKFRKPFQKGKQLLRIEHVAALGIAIGSDPLLATVKADIEDFYTMISTANSGQDGNKSMVANLSNTLEQARVAMCIAQYANLGIFISQYASNPKKLTPYFDKEAIMRREQVVFTGHVKALKSKFICKRTFAATSQLKITNKGITALIFYITLMKGKVPETLYQLVLPGTRITILATNLGDITNKMLKVYNPDDTGKGWFELEIL